MSFVIEELPRSGNFDKTSSYFYVRRYLVISTDLDNSWITVANAVLDNEGILLWDTYTDNETTDNHAYLKSVRAEQGNNKKDWIVTLEYDSSIGPHRSPIFTWDSVEREEIMVQDLDDFDVENTAGDPFNPPVTRTVVRSVVTMKFWLADANTDKIVTYKNAINSASWTSPWGDTYDAQSVRCIDYQINSPSDYQIVTFYEYTIKLEIAPANETYNPIRVLNAGVRYKPSVDVVSVLEGALVRNFPIVDQNTGHYVTSPVPLDLDGLPLGPTDDPVYLGFKRYEEVDFTNLY